MDLRKMGLKCVVCIPLTQYRGQRWALVNMVINLEVSSIKDRKYLD
jgi:hypothetical protein